MADYRYPVSGEPKTVHFDIVGRRPGVQEAHALTTIQFARKPVSGEEMKRSLKYFIIGTIIAVATWFFGRWVISRFTGIGVFVFGYGFAYVVAPGSIFFAVIELMKIFRSGRKKKVEDSFNWVWKNSYFGDDTLTTRFGKLKYAFSTLERVVPSGIPYDRERIGEYIKKLRHALSRAMDETTQEARKEPPGDWQESHR